MQCTCPKCGTVFNTHPKAKSYLDDHRETIVSRLKSGDTPRSIATDLYAAGVRSAQMKNWSTPASAHEINLRIVAMTASISNIRRDACPHLAKSTQKEWSYTSRIDLLDIGRERGGVTKWARDHDISIARAAQLYHQTMRAVLKDDHAIINKWKSITPNLEKNHATGNKDT